MMNKLRHGLFILNKRNYIFGQILEIELTTKNDAVSVKSNAVFYD